MKQLAQRPFLIFLILFLIVSIPLWTLPINLFPGTIHYVSGLQEVKEDAPLSLSYFIGLGYNKAHMDVVRDFYLKPSGYALAFIITIGIPALVAYRFYDKKK
jgi:hypothetical protein